MIYWTIDGLNKLDGRLTKIEKLHRLAAPLMQSWANNIVKSRLAGRSNYPSERGGSSYFRSGHLGDSWGVTSPTIGADNVSFSIYNSASYAVYVVGDAQGERQAWFHKGRWWRAIDRIRPNVPTLITSVADMVRSLFRGGF